MLSPSLPTHHWNFWKKIVDTVSFSPVILLFTALKDDDSFWKTEQYIIITKEMNSNFFNNIQYPVSIERVGPLALGNFPTPNHQPWLMYFLPPSHWHLSPLHTHQEGSGERTAGLALFSLCDNLCNFLKLKQIPVHLAAKRVAACVALHVINLCRELTLASPGLPPSAELLYLISRIPTLCLLSFHGWSCF